MLNASAAGAFLLAAGRLCRKKLRWKRLLGASLCAGGYSLILLLGLPGEALLLLQVPASVLLVLLAYGFGSAGELLRLTLCFWGGNLLLGALLGILEPLLPEGGLVSRGGIYYFPVRPLLLAVCIVFCYAVCFFLSRLRPKPGKKLRFRVVLGGGFADFTALVDTGNRLRDPVTGRGVLVVESAVFQDLLPQEVLHALRQAAPESIDALFWRCRCGVLPVRSAAGSTLLGTVRPKELYLLDAGKKSRVSALLAVCAQPLGGKDYQALVGEEWLPLHLCAGGRAQQAEER